MRFRSIVVFLLLTGLTWAEKPAVVAQSDGGVDGLWRAMSPDLRRIEQRMTEIRDELKLLPPLRKETWGSRYGHRSGDLEREDQPDWLQVDLGATRRVDTVVLAPVYLSYRGRVGEGYGFPKRFRVEISDDPEMRDAHTLVDCSHEDVPNPGRHPLILKVDPKQGRYLRLTVLKQFSDGFTWFWALEELMAFEGNLNVAVAKPVSSSTITDLFPQWVRVRVVDGQSAMGLPVDINAPSPSLGYLSDRFPLPYTARPPGAGDKWCVIDLGESQLIEQVQLLPIESDEHEVVGGRGFPRKLTLQLLDDLEGQVIWESGRGAMPLGYPDGSAVSLTVSGVRARYVRLRVDDMWSRDDWHVWGLAELQVIGNNRNLAAGKPVMVSDRNEKPDSAGWSPAALVDGYSSRYRLLEWPEYLALVARRGDLEREWLALTFEHDAGLRFGRRMIAGVATGLALVVVLAWIWVFTWQRLARRRELEQLRQQIARDLHDDIGSNLGGIALLSDIGSQYCPDEISRKDFASIREAAEQASVAMRDIVWLVQQSQQVGLKGLVARMRDAADMILRLQQLEFSVEPALFKDRRLGLAFRRHVFFAFKETLNNIRKHAAAKRVRILVQLGGDRLRYEIHDDGKGFEAGLLEEGGHGLGNLERRAKQLGGSFRIDSQPGQGTVVVFEAPFQS